MDPNAPKIACPYCGEINSMGSNVCGRCLRSIRQVANPTRSDNEETHFDPTARPKARSHFFRRLWRWLLGY